MEGMLGYWIHTSNRIYVYYYLIISALKTCVSLLMISRLSLREVKSSDTSCWLSFHALVRISKYSYYGGDSL